jgi:predicted transcriptional regulator
MPANMIDANARRARVLELLRQAVSLQVQFWEVQTRLESAMLDGEEISDKGSDEVLQYIKDLAAAASEVPNRIYEQIEDEHVTGVFNRADL